MSKRKLIYAVFIVLLTVSNLLIFTSLQGQINFLNSEKENLQNQVKALQSQLNTLNVTYQNYYWDFRSGFPFGYSGWGNLQIVNEGIQISQGTKYCGLIFIPCRHASEWTMETLVIFTSTDLSKYASAAILTRDGYGTNCESALDIYLNTPSASVRHMINRADELGKEGTYFTLPFKIQLNVWYKLRFAFCQNKVECYINDTKYFEKAGLHKSSVDYTQPHLAVFNGTAIFQYIRIWNLDRK